nr:MAG TPA: hypothetical protein [Caudoviricetes sp.]
MIYNSFGIFSLFGGRVLYFSHVSSKQLIFQRLGTNCEHFFLAIIKNRAIMQ